MLEATIIFVWMFQGGDGKTETAKNAAGAFAKIIKVTKRLKKKKRRRKLRILVVDLDENAKLTKGLGIKPEKVYPSLMQVYTENVPISKVIIKTKFGFDLIPGHTLLGALQDALEPGEEHLLRKYLAPVLQDYDYVILDTQPGKRPLTFSAMAAADYLLMPMQAQAQALDGIAETTRFLRDIIWPDINSNLKILGIVPVMVRRVSPNSLGTLTKAKEMWGDKVLPIEVPMTDIFSKGFSEGIPAVILDPKHEAAREYKKLAKYIVAQVDNDRAKARQS